MLQPGKSLALKTQRIKSASVITCISPLSCPPNHMIEYSYPWQYAAEASFFIEIFQKIHPNCETEHSVSILKMQKCPRDQLGHFAPSLAQTFYREIFLRTVLSRRGLSH